MMNNQKFDFYFSPSDVVKGTFKGKPYTETVIQGCSPVSKSKDIAKIGTGTFSDAKIKMAQGW